MRLLRGLFPELPPPLARARALVALGVALAAGAAAGLHRARRAARLRRLRARRRARRALLRRTLHERSTLTQRLQRDLTEGLLEVDAAGRIAFVNEAAIRMLGVDRATVVGRPLDEVTRRGHGEECPLHAPLHDGRPAHGEDLVLSRADGTRLPVSYTASPVVRSGNVVGALLTFRDFTAHLRAEEVERFIERATRIAAETIDWDATLRHIARLAVPFLGDWCEVVIAEPRGLRVAAAEHPDPPLGELLASCPLDPGAAHGAAWVVAHHRPELVTDVDLEAFAPGDSPEARRRREILREVDLRSFLSVPLVARGRTIGALSFGMRAGRRHGPRELHVAEKLAARCAQAIDNARLYREARDATRSREELLSVVSHDLRGPMTAVQLAAGIVARRTRDAGAPASRAVETLVRAAAAAMRLVDDLVASARLERGTLTLERGVHEAAGLVREAAAVAEPIAQDRGLNLCVDVAADAGALNCDAHRVLQVLSNLLGNALKVVPPGGSIRLAVTRAGPDVRFSVADTGPGIAPEDLPHLFERYWRSPRATYAGTGLGLAIVRGVVEAHGGKVEVASTPGQGTTFTFTLPAA